MEENGGNGVECCKRENKRMIPDIANADGKAGFFPATARKLNESPELKRLGIEFATIIPYRTAKNTEKKFEDLGMACIQDRMLQREKELVGELVREGKLNQDNYLVKDGSLEYRSTKEDKADKRKYQRMNLMNFIYGEKNVGFYMRKRQHVRRYVHSTKQFDLCTTSFFINLREPDILILIKDWMQDWQLKKKWKSFQKLILDHCVLRLTTVTLKMFIFILML